MGIAEQAPERVLAPNAEAVLLCYAMLSFSQTHGSEASRVPASCTAFSDRRPWPGGTTGPGYLPGRSCILAFTNMVDVQQGNLESIIPVLGKS